MRQVTVTADATGVTAPVVVDQYLNPMNVSYAKTGSGTVQITYSDPFGTAALTWATAPTTAPNAANFIGQPIRAIRISGGAEGDALTVIQTGAR
jgi:hypothetical protein